MNHEKNPQSYAHFKSLSLLFLLVLGLSFFSINNLQALGLHINITKSLALLSNRAKTGSVKGTVMDISGKPIPFATINLYLIKDTLISKAFMTTQSDAEGRYTLLNTPIGSYQLQISYSGYSPILIPKMEVFEDKVTDLGTSILREKLNNLKELKIIAKKPFIERKVDRTVLNIESDILATGENAIEVLKRAPGVSIDKDDHISLQGKQGVTVMLDGKLTYLSLDALTSLLKNTPATSIDQIEIITQPSAKYDASGNSGIINIKTKKLKKLGLNGIITSGYGHGTFSGINESLNLNFKTGKWNIFGNYDYSWSKRQNQLLILRYFNSPGLQSIFDQTSSITNDYKNHNFKGGIDFSLTKNQVIGMQVNGYSSAGQSPTDNTTKIENYNKVLDSSLKAYSDNNNQNRGVTYNVNYKNTLDTLGQEFSANFDYTTYNNLNYTQLNNAFFTPNSLAISSENTIRTNSPSKGDIKVGKLDYTLPLNKVSKLDIGVKYSRVKTNNRVDYDSLLKGAFLRANTQSNQFIYTETVGAAYTSLTTEWKKVSIVLGLRLENTGSVGNSVTYNTQLKRSYLDFFPNLSLSIKLDTNHQLGISYSRRIDRPSYEDLNPFRFYLDQYTYQIGNPYLKPQYTQSFEISNTFKQSTFLSLNFSWTKDVTSQILSQNDSSKVTNVSTQNLNNLFSYSVTFSRPFNPFSWWNINLNINANYNKYTSQGNIISAPSQIFTVGSLNKSKPSGSLNVTNTLTFPDDWTGQISAFYNAPALYGYLEAKSQYAINLGIQKSFLKKKASIKFSINDVFKTNRFDGLEIHDNVNLSVKNYFDSRRVNLSFSYSFGTNPQKRGKSTASEEEQNRIKH